MLLNGGDPGHILMVRNTASSLVLPWAPDAPLGVSSAIEFAI